MSMFDEISKQINKYPGLVSIIDEIEPFKSELNHLPHFGMVLFGPDSFKQGEVFNIIEYLKQNGFVLIDIKTKRITKTETENLFLPTSTCIECRSLKWWMIQDSAEMGEFSAAIFYSEKATQNFNCLNQLNQYKGNSNPLKNNCGVIRHDFKAINVCLNLIHIPDTYGDFFKDTSPFYSVEELFSLFSTRKKRDNRDTIEQKQLANQLFLIELYSNNNNYYCFELSFYKVKYFLAEKLYRICNIIKLDELLLHYRKLYAFFKQCSTREERYHVFLTNISSEQEAIFDIQSEIKDQIANHQNKRHFIDLISAYQISELLLMITDPNYFVQTGDSFFTKLTPYDITIDLYEQLIIKTTLFQWKK